MDHSPLPFRQGILLACSVLPLVLGFFVGSWMGADSILSIILFLLSLFATVSLAFVPSTKWLAAIWPIIFILLGLNIHNDDLVYSYAVAGAAFAVMFVMIRSRSDNHIHPSFFEAAKPALTVFMLLLIISYCLGIAIAYTSEDISDRIIEGIGSMEEMSLPGGEKMNFGDVMKTGDINAIAEDAFKNAQKSVLEGGFLDPVIENMVDQKIYLDCVGDPQCMDTVDRTSIFQEIKSELMSSMEKISLDDVSRETGDPGFMPDSEAMSGEAKDFLSQRISNLGENYNLNVISAVFVFLILAPFSGLFAWILSLVSYLGFFLFRLSGVIRKTECTVTQIRYV